MVRPPDPPENKLEPRSGEEDTKAGSRAKLESLMSERREKARTLRAAGMDPYRNDVGPTTTIAAVRIRYEPTRPPPPPPPAPGAPREKGTIAAIDGEPMRVAGRIMARRGMGKTVFAPVRDASGELQLFLNVDHLAAADFANVLPQLDIGDIVVAEGAAFWTRTGELSILVTRLWLATKSLRPLPAKEFTTDGGAEKGGFTDVEQRYRQRYVDMIANPEVRDVFRKRSQIVRGIRAFLDARDYLEVETPMMHPIVGGAAARPFVTHHNALDLKLYMRIAPELYLKRLVVGGFDRVYEINRNFRNEGLSRAHNPEFTMLEFYWAYVDYETLMRFTEELLSGVAEKVTGSVVCPFGEHQVSFAAPFRRLSLRHAAAEEASKRLGRDVSVAELRTLDGATAVATALHIDVPPGAGAGRIATEIFERLWQEHMIQPTFVYDFPTEVSPLSKQRADDPDTVERFELYIGGFEVANAFSELNDPDEQRRRFEEQLAGKAKGDDEAHAMDEDYVRALEYGLPPTGGEGIGIDRLVMLLSNSPSIRDVILFPQMRPRD